MCGGNKVGSRDRSDSVRNGPNKLKNRARESSLNGDFIFHGGRWPVENIFHCRPSQEFRPKKGSLRYGLRRPCPHSFICPKWRTPRTKKLRALAGRCRQFCFFFPPLRRPLQSMNVSLRPKTTTKVTRRFHETLRQR